MSAKADVADLVCGETEGRGDVSSGILLLEKISWEFGFGLSRKRLGEQL